MRRASDENVAFIVVIVSAILLLVAGVLAGLQEDWFRMSLFLFSSALLVLFGMSDLLARRLRTYLRQLASQFSIDDPMSAYKAGLTTYIVFLLMFVPVPISLSLAIIVGLHQNGFWLGVCLFACAITVIIGAHALTIVEVKGRLNYLQKLIPNPDQGRDQEGQEAVPRINP